MSINNLNTYLNVRDAHLRVVSGNVYAQAMNIGGINVETAHGLQSVSNTGNATSLTLEFANVTTGFVTTANAQIGRDLVVTGNATVSKELTVTSNAIVSSNLNVSDDLIVTNNILASNNLTVTGNLNVTTIRSDSNVVAEYTGPHDRPLRKYPEIILPRGAVGAEYNGYRIDRSSEHVTGPYDGVQDLFNETAVDYADTWGAGWQGSSGAYSTSTGEHTTFVTGGTTQGTGANLSSSSGVPNGEWVSLKSPNAIKLDNIQIRSRNANDWYAQFPTDFQIWGSNDGTTWSHVKTITGQAAFGQAQLHTFSVNSTTFYNRHALVVTKIPGTASTIVVSTGQAHFSISELRFNANEEGSGSLDTTLKTVYNVPATTGTQLEVYYDAKETSSYPESGTTVTDLSGKGVTGTLTAQGGFENVDNIKAFTSSGSTTHALTATTSLSGSPVMTISAWVKFDSFAPTSIIYLLGDSAVNNQMVWLGTQSNGSIWTLANGGSGAYNQYSSNDPPILNSWIHVAAIYSGGTYPEGLSLYKNGRLMTPTVRNGSGVSLTLPSNSPLYLGFYNSGTEFFDGSIANFRLYSKALNADQVKELYDYQKDYFLGSKSQLTLYKGHLGVGVTEPSGQLELAGDERLQEYPPGPMSNWNTHIPGHGTFCATASSEYTDQTNPVHAAWTAFNKNWDTVTNSWASASDTVTDGDGLPSSTAANFQGISGNWLQLKLPYKIQLKQFKFETRVSSNSPEELPGSGIVYGSNDEVSWDVVHSFSGVDYGGATGTVRPLFTVNSTKQYSIYRLLVTKNYLPKANLVWSDIGEWRLFGTPGPTTLDKGSLTLGRSLDVPRVSRYDVDTETPRPEKLVLDLDTTVNSSPTDISGKGNHGTFNGGATYSVADKAFTGFPSSSANYISGTLSGVSGAYAHTQSYWVNGADTTPRAAFTVGKDISTTREFLNIWFTTSKWVLNADGATTSGEWAETIHNNRWYHVVLTYDGGSSASSYKLYINGEYKTPTTAITASTTLNLPSNPEYRIGRNNGSQWYNGMVSNPKVYSVVLEPSEVKKLYKLGRTGRSMVISDTAVGIGKAPEAQLDVRGNLRVGGTIQVPLIISHRSITADTTVTALNYIPFSGIIYENPSGLHNGNYFVCPIKGVYECVANILTDNNGSYSGNHTWLVNGSETSPTSRGFAVDLAGNNHKQATSHFYFEVNSGDTIGLAGTGTITWYGDSSHRHSAMSIRLITPT